MSVKARVVCLALLLLFPASAQANAPTEIPVQGFLADANGAAVNDVFSVTFTLYAEEAGTTTLWSEEVAVNFVNGYFTAYLGASTVLDLTLFRDNSNVFLGVQVGSDEEMPAFPLATSPFAAFAQFAGNADDLSDTAKLGIVDDVALQLSNDGKVHDKYTDDEVDARITLHNADLNAHPHLIPQVFRYRQRDGNEYTAWTALGYADFTGTKMYDNTRLKITWTDS